MPASTSDINNFLENLIIIDKVIPNNEVLTATEITKTNTTIIETVGATLFLKKIITSETGTVALKYILTIKHHTDASNYLTFASHISYYRDPTKIVIDQDDLKMLLGSRKLNFTNSKHTHNRYKVKFFIKNNMFSVKGKKH